MNSIKTIISMIESKAIDDGLKFRNQINAEAQCKVGSEFEKYFKENHADSFYSVDAALEMRGDDYIDFHAADLWALWQHQQSKVDELQKRVDKALKILSSKKKMYVDMFIELEQALKGEK